MARTSGKVSHIVHHDLQLDFDDHMTIFRELSPLPRCMNVFQFNYREYHYGETICGGSGAGAGTHGVHVHMTNTRITDIETIRKGFPVVVCEFATKEGCGGPLHRWKRRTSRVRALLATLHVQPEEGIVIHTPGGGGWDALLDRDPISVKEELTSVRKDKHSTIHDEESGDAEKPAEKPFWRATGSIASFAAAQNEGFKKFVSFVSNPYSLENNNPDVE
ncbi:hypothetical protein C8J56DRAFT_884142 [Mycena floridula]|nr:hypothetical protein C8J56DRAFT_884142 [Mycena floridula]